MRASIRERSLLTLLLLSHGIPALAHSGHGESGGFLNGALHAATGADHVAVMLAIGLWAVALGGAALWLLPLSFAGMMALGGVGGLSWLDLPMTESWIAGSLAVFGWMVWRRQGLGTPAALFTVCFFALFHGYAHARELPPGQEGWAFGLGLLLATLGLHGLGLATGFAAAKTRIPLGLYRIFGAACAGFGAYLLAAG